MPTFEALGEFDDWRVGMLHLEVEFDRLQEDTFEHHDFLTRISAESGKLSVVRELTDHFDDVFALFRRFFGLAGQKEATGWHDVSGEILESVEHVEPMVVHGPRGHRVVAQIQGFSELHEKSMSRKWA